MAQDPQQDEIAEQNRAAEAAKKLHESFEATANNMGVETGETEKPVATSTKAVEVRSAGKTVGGMGVGGK